MTLTAEKTEKNEDVTQQPVAQRCDEMFERNLAIWVSRTKELRFVLTDGSEVTGWMSGMDEGHFQVAKSELDQPSYLTQDIEYALINRDHEVLIEGTGRDLRDMLEGTDLVVKEFAKLMQTKTSNFTRIMKAKVGQRRDLKRLNDEEYYDE